MPDANDPTDPNHEYDRPDGSDQPVDPEVSKEVRDLTPSFKVVDKRKYFELIKYQPHGRQWLYHKSPARFKIAVAGRRAGKSSMAGRDVQPRLLVPNRRIWCVGATYTLSEKEFRFVWDDMIVKLGFGRERKVKKAYNVKQGNMFIEFPWNTRIEARSAERSDTLIGERLDHVIMSEAAAHVKDTWYKQIQPALADVQGTADFPTTPRGMDWVYDLWQYGQNPKYEGFSSWRYPAWENPYVYPGGKDDPEIKLLRQTLPNDVFLQEIAAEFTAFEGRIYDEWEEQTHVREVPYDPSLPNYVSFDWGYVNPMAAIEFQVDSMQRVRVWRELYLSRTTLESYLKIMQSRPQPEGYKVDLCFGDAADPEAVDYVSEHFHPCVADPLSKSNWREGIEEVKKLLKLQQVGEADEYGTPLMEPWLTVDHSCINTIREFNNYRTNPMGKTERNLREEAKKHEDHCLVAGTIVTTVTGDIPIEELVVGDKVLTRLGYRSVLGTFKRGSFEIYRLVTSGGREVYGTSDHPILTDRGWVLLRELMPSDTVFTWSNIYGEIQIGRTGTGLPGIIGENHTDQFPKGTIYTTSTEIPGIMGSRILNVCLNGTTPENIPERMSDILECSPIWTKLENLLQNGTEVLKDALGTENMEGALGKIGKFLPESAIGAEPRTRLHSIGTVIGTAPTNARALVGVLRALTMRREYVPVVDQTFELTSTKKLRLVPESVVELSVERTKQQVYDICVLNEHEFFANGILVSNSMDALRYGIMHVYKLGVNMRLSDVLSPNDLVPVRSDGGFFISDASGFFRSGREF